jgi:hypothetical protein
VSQTEFQNILVSPGVLASVLARNASVGRWQVLLVGQQQQACGTPEAGFLCIVREVDDPSVGDPAVQFKTLTREAPSGDEDANKFVLRGSATAGRDGVITLVATNVVRCTPQTAPATPCDTGGVVDIPRFTEHSTSPGISVSAGQQIQVTVKISFS